MTPRTWALRAPRGARPVVVDRRAFGPLPAPEVLVEVPDTPLDPATALPVQIYLWADSPERAFVERTSAAIMVLLAFLLVMNGLAIWMRKKFERRW